METAGKEGQWQKVAWWGKKERGQVRYKKGAVVYERKCENNTRKKVDEWGQEIERKTTSDTCRWERWEISNKQKNENGSDKELYSLITVRVIET